jgi:class 3 adenylate cyclase
MRHFGWLLLLLLSSAGLLAQTEEIEEIKVALSEAESARERMVLRYELAEAYLRVDAEEAESIAKQAYSDANDQNNHAMAAQAALLVANAYDRQRNKDRYVENWLKSALAKAKQADDLDMVMRITDRRARIAVKERDYRDAYQTYQEGYEYLSRDGRSVSQIQTAFEARRAQIEREKRALQREKDELEFQIRNLRTESDQLSAEKGQLEQRTVQLSEAVQQKEEEVTSKTEELEIVAEEKARAEARARARAREVDQLSEEKAKAELIRQEAENEAMQAKLRAQEQEIILYMAAGAVVLLLLLSLLFYSRFRAKRKATKILEQQNRLVEAERERSDELLLNILPASIAAELKEKGKAQARQYKEATVLFSDFKNFTSIAEQLTPDELVQELDKCFKGFDFILEQYPDVEKIKTIGDAYMCASGLNDRANLPNNMVKAALEMQAFLEEQKQERQRIGKPYFEARIGIHTGPVVAGVVGVKKFAYDIWGDTVNTAARVEANSLPGKVNISETTYGKIKYQFECTYRGKVEAKNKGMIEMYFVERELVGATV